MKQETFDRLLTNINSCLKVRLVVGFDEKLDKNKYMYDIPDWEATHCGENSTNQIAGPASQ